jgi:hypothetical protein
MGRLGQTETLYWFFLILRRLLRFVIVITTFSAVDAKQADY